MNKLMTGDVLHCTGSSLLARLIRKFTKSKFSHTAFVVECWGQIYIVDAQRDGVNPRPFEEWVKKYNYSYVVSRKKNPHKDYGDWISIQAFKKVGSTPYDFASLLFWYPLYILTGKWHGKTSRKNNDKRLYCSEYVGWLVGIPDYWAASPQEVYDYCIRHNAYLTFSFPKTAENHS